MTVTALIACEVGFWVLLAVGLLARYRLRRPRLGLAFLALTPLLDVGLLAVAALDLRDGGRATLAHGIAAVYLGFSIAYGHRIIKWADAEYTYRFNGGPPPERLHGRAYMLKSWRDVALTGIGAALTAGIVVLLRAVASPSADAAALGGLFPILGVVFAVEVISAVAYTLWPRRPRYEPPHCAADA